MKTLNLLLAFSFFLLIACGDKKETVTVQSNNFLTPEIMCGTVQFVDGCGEKTDSLIRFGLALLHHMTYEDAEYTFDRIIADDPDCFWGHWGKAMTYIHPLWPDHLTEDQMTRGYILSQKALSLAKKPNEKLYGAALAAFYQKGDLAKPDRLSAFQKGWVEAHAQLPDDPEAELFNGLFRLAVVSPADKTFAIQTEVGASAERLLAKYPDHPGAFHYAIHAYDVPPLATKALNVARNYGKIAPEIPHALHMPSHIFTRLGLWDESIEWNTRSAKAALRLPYGDKVSPHVFHALDYLVYAHLQYGEDDKARDIVKGVDTLTLAYFVSPVTAYSLAAMKARLALENRKWEEAANLPIPDTSKFAWSKFPQYEALIYYARGIGGARSGKPEIANQSLERLDQLQKNLGDTPQTKYWHDQIEAEKLAVKAWIAFATNHKDDGLALIKQAADLEDATQKNPVSPGELLPIREQAGDMLMEMGQPKEALVHYRQTNTTRPNRFNTVYGAAKAAEESGDAAAAKEFYAKLLSLKGDEPTNREQFAYAEKMVNGK